MFFFFFFFSFLHFDNIFVVFCCFLIWFKFTFSPFLKVWIVLSLLFFPLEPESCQNWGAKKQKISLRVAYDLRNKCFPVEHLLVSNRGCMQHDGVRVEVVLVKERQVNMSPNKAWVHFAAALPPGPPTAPYTSQIGFLPPKALWFMTRLHWPDQLVFIFVKSRGLLNETIDLKSAYWGFNLYLEN